MIKLQGPVDLVIPPEKCHQDQVKKEGSKATNQLDVHGSPMYIVCKQLKKIETASKGSDIQYQTRLSSLALCVSYRKYNYVYMYVEKT